MTYYYEKDESLQKDIWHWIGVCNTQAQSIGLHRDPTKSNMTSDAKRLRIRLWWCLYSRDRLIALALHRPTQINEGICNVPPLALTDLDTKPFHGAVNNDILLGCSYMGDAYLQRRLAVMFIEKVKLCQCLGRVLFAHYSPFNGVSGTTRETTITLIPRQSSDAELQRCSQKLDAWLSRLPDEATFTAAPREKKELSDGDDVLYLHSSMLQMVYHATCSALYRPRASSSAPTPETTPETSITMAKKRMRDAASATTETAYRLRHLGLTPYLPSYALTVMTPAAIVHMTNLHSTNPAVRDKSTWNFRLCIEVISDMRDIYPAADYESAYLEIAIQQLQQRTSNMPAVVHDDHRQWGPACISVVEQPICGEQTWDWSGKFHADTSTDEGIAPQRLIYNETNNANDNDNESNENDDDSIEFWAQIPTLSSLDDEGMITGDLERDLGFI
jgi:Fungal specific transcription factor domain